MASNPNPSRISGAGWWFMEQLLAMEKGTANGGIFANKSGYHNTRANNNKSWPGNYSVVDPVDKKGPSDKAAAYDWTFRDAQAGRYETINKYTNRLLKSAKDMDDPRLNGWREFYGQADKDRQVEGWDTRYLRSATSDPSHLWHIHFSEDRDKVDDYDNKRAMLSVLRGETVAQWRGQDDMELKDRVAMAEWIRDNFPELGKDISVATALGSTYGHARSTKEYVLRMERESKIRDEAILAAVKGLDTKAVLDAVAKAAKAGAERDAQLLSVVEDFASGELNAEQVATRVVAIMGERLGE